MFPKIYAIKKVYFIPGLGADKRVFKFLDLSFCNPVFIDWAIPAKNESLPSYSERLFKIINDDEATIVGLSFGGMLATEIAIHHPRTKVILVSSAKTYKELPFYLRMWRHLPIYKLHSQKNKNVMGRFALKILGSKGEEQQKLQLKILADSDPSFTRWATGAILNWRNTVVPKNVIHIHGTADKLLPYKFVKADYTVQGGEHVMLMDMPVEVSAILKKIIGE